LSDDRCARKINIQFCQKHLELERCADFVVKYCLTNPNEQENCSINSGDDKPTINDCVKNPQLAGCVVPGTDVSIEKCLGELSAEYDACGSPLVKRMIFCGKPENASDPKCRPTDSVTKASFDFEDINVDTDEQQAIDLNIM
jgi:hypothetical protein